MAAKNESAYAKAGVDYSKIDPFKQTMIEWGRKTLTFPNARGVFINKEVTHAHGSVFYFKKRTPHLWCKVQEGLGNLNWIAEWMDQYGWYLRRDRRTFYNVIARAAALVIVIDVIAQGAMPVVWTDEVAAGDSEWFTNKQKTEDYALGCFEVCKEIGMAIPAGESPSLRYLVKAEEPVKSAPVLSGSVTGIIAPPGRLITGKKLKAGDIILGTRSSGIHANGISLIIKKALQLPDRFLTKLPSGNSLGEECLKRIPSYVALVDALLNNDIDIHAILPATGDGLDKLAYDWRPFTYRIHSWVKKPEIFWFIRENLNVNLRDCLKTFNWGIGIYFFLPRRQVKKAIDAAKKAGYELTELGVVEKGERKVIFEPEGIILPPPGR